MNIVFLNYFGMFHEEFRVPTKAKLLQNINMHSRYSC